jgi:uncharacterized protein (TIGR01777 family)
MRVVVSGASGLIGTALVARLRASRHEVLRLVRRDPQGPDEVRWDPASGLLDARDLAGVDAAVNLSGAGIGDKRWSDQYKALIRSSRIDSTRTLSTVCASLEPAPAVLLQGSAIGYYGNANGDQVLTERDSPGTDFLADVVRDWEAAAQPAVQAGIRVAYLRTGLVMTPRGGSFGKLLPIFKAGLGGKLGDGQMWWSWITLPDHVAAVEFLLASDIDGPVNLTAPDPVTNADFTKSLGGALHRPTLIPVPKLALDVVLGDFSDDVLGSARVMPTVLQDAGFAFDHATIEQGAAHLAGKS